MKDLDETSEEHLTLEQIVAPIWAKRKKIAIVSLIVAVLTYGVNLLLPMYYKSTATLLPETEKSKLSSLGQFADIAQLAGVNIPGSEIARLYPTIVSSETVLRSVIEKKYLTASYPDSVNLIRYMRLDEGTPAKDMAEAVKLVRSLLSSTYDAKNSVVSLSVEMREPQLAADVLNAIIGELDNFMRSKRSTSASEQVKWIAVRLDQVQQELRNAEDVLKNFREKNRKVSDSPQLLLEQERLMRQVQVNSTIFIELKKQFELAKLEEIKNITIVNVLDKGMPPAKKDRPQRSTNTAILFLLAIAGMSTFYSGRAAYGDKLKEKWNLVKRG